MRMAYSQERALDVHQGAAVDAAEVQEAEDDVAVHHVQRQPEGNLHDHVEGEVLGASVDELIGQRSPPLGTHVVAEGERIDHLRCNMHAPATSVSATAATTAAAALKTTMIARKKQQ